MNHKVLFLILSISPLFLKAQESNFFQGEIDYDFIKTNYLGKKLFAVQESEKEVHNNGNILLRTTKGQLAAIMNGEDLLLSSTEAKRFQVNYTKRKLIELDSEPVRVRDFREISRHKNDTTILGYNCMKVQIAKYSENENDTLVCEYFFSELKLAKSTLIAGLQGNQNTRILDGSYGLIPLKIKIRSKKGYVLTIFAKSVKRNAGKDYFQFDDFEKVYLKTD